MRHASPTNSPRLLRHSSFSNVRDINECVYKNDIDGVKTRLQQNAMAWNTKNPNGLTPLMVASTLNRLEILDILLSSKCDVNATDENGNTSLHQAVDEGNTDVVRKFMECGRCILEAMNSKGETALMKAAFYDYSDMVRILLKDGDANADARDKTGQSALLIALREGSHVTVDILLKHGCDVTVTDNLGQSALYIAVHSPCSKTLDLAKKLVSSGYDNSIDKMWILNEEKHNIFYQDDDFYANLRRRLRANSSDRQSVVTINRKHSTDSNTMNTDCTTLPTNIRSPVVSPLKQTSPTTTPFTMSPTLKQKIMSPRTSKFPSIPFSQLALSESVNLHSPVSSPLCSRRNDFRKAASFEQMRPKTALRPPLTSSFSSDSDDSPIGSPAFRHRMTSQSLKFRQSNMKNDSSVQEQSSSATQEQSSTILKRSEHSEHATTKLGRSATFSNPSRKPGYLRSEGEMHSAPNSPIIKYHRMLSSQVSMSGSLGNINPRKISLPTKMVVQFSTEIQVIEYNRR